MRTNIRFKSTKFFPLKPEDEQVNPQVYGEELAMWIVDNIARHGLPDADYLDEDWGWRVFFGKDFPIWIACGNVDGTKTEWLCFCVYDQSFFDRILRKPPPTKEMEKTVKALYELLRSEPEITEIECFEVDKRQQEQNHASAPFS